MARFALIITRSLAHLLLAASLTVRAQALDCGAAGRRASVVAVEPRGELRLDDGARARFGGLALEPEAAAELTGRRFQLALLAAGTDRWGRLVVDLVEDDGQSVALALLQEGRARVTPEFEARACAAERLEAESAARAAGEGLWAKPGAILDATDRAGLEAADGRFVLVAGILRRVGEGRARVYLDFAKRGGFSVVVARKNEPLFQRRGIDIRGWIGRRVLVRGVLDNRFGPRIEVADPSSIELDEGAKETKRAE